MIDQRNFDNFFNGPGVCVLGDCMLGGCAPEDCALGDCAGDYGEDYTWGVYVHIPFCVSRCNYCDFNTYTGMERYAGAYFMALLREAGMFFGYATPGAAHRPFRPEGGFVALVDTIFIGGGTPSAVEPEYISGLLEMILRYAVPQRAADQCRPSRLECTIEANPGTLDRNKLKIYARAGVNRISFGLQSTHNAHLKMLGRIHSYEDFKTNINEARNAGFENINADLLFGLPGQTIAEWEQSLETVVNMGIRHLSCYSLTIDAGVPLHSAIEDGELPALDEDLDRDMYCFACSYLRSAGIYQYELSNFAAPGFECRHNIKYWTGARYIGFGAGAHSFDGSRRFSNVPAIDDYINRIEAGAAPVAESSEIDATEREKEFIILRLRLTEGFSDGEFTDIFGNSFTKKYSADVAKLETAGLLELTPDYPHSNNMRIKLTPKGMDLANQVFIRFI